MGPAGVVSVVLTVTVATYQCCGTVITELF
jgi:hypothetical protein